jgi:hypothetical protein
MQSSSERAIAKYFNVLGLTRPVKAGLELTTYRSRYRGSTTETLRLKSKFPHKKVSQYDTQNKHRLYIPKRKAELFKNSFVPDSLKLWNLLDIF